MLPLSVPSHSHDNQQSLLLAWVSTQIHLSRPRLKLILEHYGTFQQGVQDNFSALRRLPKNDWLAKFHNQDVAQQVDEFATILQQSEIKLVSYLDEKYPEKFQVLQDPPLVLYYQGDWSAVYQKQLITVVGTRHPSFYGKKLVTEILAPVCQLGVGVVSGLARGIDTLAHQTALAKQATTIAVIGSGLDASSFYPRENWELRQQILDQAGLILSEYPPGTPPNTFHFPRRNRLLAALSEVTWIVQAGIKSGSLITALAAQDLGKTVATTPGSIYDASVSGNLNLLKNGASYISQPEDILQLLGLRRHPPIVPAQTPQFNSPEEQLIWQKLSLEPQLADHISLQTGLDIQTLNGILTMLELNNLAICVGENKWIRG